MKKCTGLILPVFLLLYATAIAQDPIRPDNYIDPLYAPAPVSPEPSVETARSWWPDQRNIWTPIGWKDHYFRFNILYNGSVICEPCPHWAPTRVHSKRWLGQDFLLTFTPSPDGNPPPVPKEKIQLWKVDGGHGVQGWRTDKETPVLWTDHTLQEGMVIRQEVFAHVKGSRNVETGIEPIYAWIRLSVTHVDALRAPARFPMAVQLSKLYYFHHERYLFEDGITVDADPALAPYPKSLRSQPFSHAGSAGQYILEPDGKVRLIVLPATAGKVTFSERQPGIYALKVNMEAKVGDHADLLVPMLPEPQADIAAEQALGFDGALAACEPYWSEKPATAAHIHVPEPYINRLIAQSLKFAEVIAEKDYVNGEYTYLTGSWGYDNVWSTPTSMTSHMFLSLLGYHDAVARHADLFLKNQGTVKPPGPAYSQHPGYFSTPKTLTAFDWLSDHGAILHQVCTHALLSGDTAFIRRWIGPIVKACDFLKDMCARTDHDGVKGLLPPAVATDELIPTQGIPNLSWNYKGLTSAVRLLRQLHHPRAAEFEAFARQFRNTFRTAYHELAAKGPQWTDSAGKKHPKPPVTLSSKPMPFHPFTEAFYLDGGPMSLVWAGLLDADDELMRSVVDFFRHGPNRRLYGTRFNPLSRPVLNREISSCEPCYSWNIFHSWQLADRPRFLEGVYSLFTGAVSQQTFTGCEHRHGIQGLMAPTAFAFTLARLSVLDDEIAPGEIHLLRLCPLAWISDREETVFDKMPTAYGPVNLRFKKSADGKTLQVTFRGDWRNRPHKVVLHTPPLPGLETLVVNGKELPAKGAIQL